MLKKVPFNDPDVCPLSKVRYLCEMRVEISLERTVPPYLGHCRLVHGNQLCAGKAIAERVASVPESFKRYFEVD